MSANAATLGGILRLLSPILAVALVTGVSSVGSTPAASRPPGHLAPVLADAHVSAAAPARNFGRARALTASPRATAYVRFRAPALGSAFSSARLRLYVVRGRGRVFFHAVAARTWSERRMTYRRAPATGKAVASASVGRDGTWVTFDVSPLVRRPGPVTIAVSASTTVAFGSRERGRGARLELTPAPQDTVVLAAGDIAACDSQGDEATARLLDGLPGTILLLGDIAYPSGRPEDFRCYDASWGRFKARTRPAVGNHEYLTRDASAYFDYFGAAAGERGKGYYSFDQGAWHLIALNSNCSRAGGCGRGSPQERWLRADLAASRKRCTLAYWHHPLFSSGEHGAHPAVRPLWDALYDAGAELVLVGHDHVYERFAPQTPAGVADGVRGIRQFTVGTGGKNHTRFRAPRPNSEVREATTFGVLKLVLTASGYSWQFVPEAGKTFSDGGSGSCR